VTVEMLKTEERWRRVHRSRNASEVYGL